MKITRIESIPISVPLKKGLTAKTAHGEHVVSPYVIVKVHTDAGIVGLGEATISGLWSGETQAGTVAAIAEYIAPQLIGTDPRNISAARRAMDFVIKLNPFTKAAVEMALWDIAGKAVGLPVYQLLGGKVRDRVPFSAYLFYKHAGAGGMGADVRKDDEYGEIMTPDAVVRSCKQMIAKYGFKEVKLKGGVVPPDEEIAAIKALRVEFGPKIPLRIDPNCAWSVDTSVRVGRELKAELADGGYLEDPCAGMDGMAEVRRRLLAEGNETPLASNVVTTCFAHVPEAKRTDGVQIVLSDPHYWGGIRNQQKLSDLCEVLGLGMSMHSNNHLGVSLMTMAHAAAVCPSLTYACDTHYPWQTEIDEVVVGGRIKFDQGSVVIPDKPGLGVELDYDQVARGVERYDKLPYRKRDDEAEMRKHVDPNWKRILPRW